MLKLQLKKAKVYKFWRNRIFLPHPDQVVVQQQYPSLGLLLCQEPIHCLRKRQINNQSGLLAQYISGVKLSLCFWGYATSTQWHHIPNMYWSCKFFFSRTRRRTAHQYIKKKRWVKAPRDLYTGCFSRGKPGETTPNSHTSHYPKTRQKNNL